MELLSVDHQHALSRMHEMTLKETLSKIVTVLIHILLEGVSEFLSKCLSLMSCQTQRLGEHEFSKIILFGKCM